METITKQFTDYCESTRVHSGIRTNTAVSNVTASTTNHSGRSKPARAGRRVMHSDFIRQRRQNEERGGGSDGRLQC